jgi:3',5'-nucleoside bisphosphate phosphatase
MKIRKSGKKESGHIILFRNQKAWIYRRDLQDTKTSGKDEIKLSLIEEAIPGITLFDKLQQCDDQSVIKYLKMTAGCLAELHNLRLRVTPEDEFFKIEKERLDYYMSIFYKEDHPHTERIQLISNEVFRIESEAIKNSDFRYQGHGDFHLKNIYAAEDEITGTEYLALIDFHSSYVMLPEFDAGTFLSQYRNMFFDNPEFLRNFLQRYSSEEYPEKLNQTPEDFYSNVQLYKARANLSILYYLVKVGKGNSENFWTVLVETERILLRFH